MSDDDLFWPPLSSGANDEPGTPGQPGLPGEHPTQPLSHLTSEFAVQRRPRQWTSTALVAVTAFVFGGGGVAIGAELVNNNSSSGTSSAGLQVSSAAPSALTTTPKSFAAIAARVLPSVVSINVTGANEADTGSGVILKSDGYILTNNHVVAAAVSGGTVSVDFNDGSTASARIVGTDSLDDLAVIKVNRTGLTAASLGDSGAIQVGDPVLAVGSPLGLSGTVTQGIVSALNRPVVTQEEEQQQNTDPFGFGNGEGNNGQQQAVQQPVIDAIQTDAAINPGNSGGALVDAAGQVIGINSAIASLGSDSLSDSQSGNIGVGFSIPINQARTIADELITTGHATHPLLGVSLAGDTADGTSPKGTVEGVTSGGPADKAGIKKGDVIIDVDGVPTPSSDAVIAVIRSHTPGQQVAVTLLRGGARQTVTATLTTESSTQE